MKNRIGKIDNMKILVAEIFRVYKKAPIKITMIWFLDLVEALILIFNPYIIGNCIDGLLKKDIFWFIVLVVIDTTFWLSRSANKFLDTRIYSKIVGYESYDYYTKMLKTNEDNSLIDARLDMVDDIPNFLEIDFFQILNVVGGIIMSIIFLYLNSTLLVFSFALVSIVLIPFSTYRLQKEIVSNNKKYKNLEEERMKNISSRDKRTYGEYIKKVLNIGILNSDLDTKIFFVTNFLQMILLFFSILSITQANRFTSGLLFSTVTYVGMLNGYVGDINEYLILLQDLKETVYRLKGENNNELQR